jgi:hypothetical protein
LVIGTARRKAKGVKVEGVKAERIGNNKAKCLILK